MATYGQTGSYRSAMDPTWANSYLGASSSLEPGKAIKDLIGLPNSGIQNVEISVVQAEKFEAIPRELFSEARRLGKMLIRDFTKDGKASPISMHSPIVEPTGFAENRWDETTRMSSQNQLMEVVDKAAMLGPSVPLTIHGSHVPSMQTVYDPVRADEYLKSARQYAQRTGRPLPEETEAMLNKKEIPQMMVAVDSLTGEIVPLKAEVRKVPFDHFWSPQDKLEEHNRSSWHSQQQQLAGYMAEISRLESSHGANPQVLETYKDTLVSSASTMFENACRADPSLLKRAEVQNALKTGGAMGAINAIFAISSDNPPQLIRPMEKFAQDKASETFANVAMRSFDIATAPGKHGLNKEQVKELQMAGVTDVSKAPIITIENVSPEVAFGRGDSLKALVEESRTKFAEKLMHERHVPQGKAKEIAGKLIGATWDVGHINLLRRYGYNDEQIIAEFKRLAPDVKHVHLTDNFGYSDAHLAPGMGNVPIKEFAKILEKEGKLGKVRGIVEAGGYVMSYGENPTLKTLQYFNTPAYNFQGAPSWGGEGSIAGGYFMGSSGYSSGYGLMLPPIHYGEYGAGFTGLPTALGAVPGTAQRSAFAGTPNA